jgi:hypothetical protein
MDLISFATARDSALEPFAEIICTRQCDRASILLATRKDLKLE